MSPRAIRIACLALLAIAVPISIGIARAETPEAGEARSAAPMPQRQPAAVPEAPASPPTIDTNRDGKPDAWDRDGNGKPDAWDTDGDGQPDKFDSNGDGKPD